MATKTTKTAPSTPGGSLKKWFIRLIAAAVLYVTCQFLDTIKVGLVRSLEEHLC